MSFEPTADWRSAVTMPGSAALLGLMQASFESRSARRVSIQWVEHRVVVGAGQPDKQTLAPICHRPH